MPQPKYTVTGLVVSRRSFSESDLIIRLLLEDGSALDCIARGARKAKSPFANRLDLFCASTCQIAPARNLDIVCEARLVFSPSRVAADPCALFAASPIAETLAKCAHEGLKVERLFDMALAALRHIDTAPERHLQGISCAYLLKLAALLGVKPELDSCVSCGGHALVRPRGGIAVSAAAGGVLCAACSPRYDTVRISEQTHAWARFLLLSTFDGIVASDEALPRECALAILELCRAWLAQHFGINCRSIDQLASCGLF